MNAFDEQMKTMGEVLDCLDKLEEDRDALTKRVEKLERNVAAMMDMLYGMQQERDAAVLSDQTTSDGASEEPDSPMAVPSGLEDSS